MTGPPRAADADRTSVLKVGQARSESPPTAYQLALAAVLPWLEADHRTIDPHHALLHAANHALRKNSQPNNSVLSVNPRNQSGSSVNIRVMSPSALNNPNQQYANFHHSRQFHPQAHQSHANQSHVHQSHLNQSHLHQSHNCSQLSATSQRDVSGTPSSRQLSLQVPVLLQPRQPRQHGSFSSASGYYGFPGHCKNCGQVHDNSHTVSGTNLTHGSHKSNPSFSLEIRG